MKKGFNQTLIWILSVILTLTVSIYQRKTGPTYPSEVHLQLADDLLNFELPRSHGGDSGCEIRIPASESTKGQVIFRKYPGSFESDTLVMHHEQGYLVTKLPHQPPAGKLAYSVQLYSMNDPIDSVHTKPVIIRYKGSVPAWALIPHILFIFAAMIFSTASGILALSKTPEYKKVMLMTILLLVLGGFIFGPIVQKFAFGDFWTGWPKGRDLTDNKVLLLLILWIIAFIGNRKRERRWLAVLASIGFIGITLIPHSVAGSELNYETGEVMTGLAPLVSIGFGDFIRKGCQRLCNIIHFVININ